MSKIVFLDVDGTLIDYETKFTWFSKKSCWSTRAHGHKVYICTGCSKRWNLTKKSMRVDGMILGNGTYVEDHDHVIMHQAMPLEEVKKVFIGVKKEILLFT